MKLSYHWEGEYLIPDLVPPESPKIGIWGERRRRFLRTHQRPVYDAMMMHDTLNTHLEEVDQAAEKMLDQLMCKFHPNGAVGGADKYLDFVCTLISEIFFELACFHINSKRGGKSIFFHDLDGSCCINVLAGSGFVDFDLNLVFIVIEHQKIN